MSDTATINNDMDVDVEGSQDKVVFTGKLQDKVYQGCMNAGKLKSGSWNTNTTFTVSVADKT